MDTTPNNVMFFLGSQGSSVKAAHINCWHRTFITNHALPCCFARMLSFLGLEDLRFIAWMSFFMLCQAAGFSAVLVQYLCIDAGQPAYAVAKGSAQSIQVRFEHTLIVIKVCLHIICSSRSFSLINT